MQVNVSLGGGAAALTLLISLAVWYDSHLKNSTDNYINDLKNQIETYEKSNSWKLPETLKQLNSASEKLDKQLQSQADIAKLMIDKEELEKTNSQLKKTFNSLSEENGSLRIQVSSLTNRLREVLITPKELVLTRGTSTFLVKNEIALGVESVYPTWVTGHINNGSFSLYVGNQKSIEVMNETCNLTLTKISPPSAYFNYTCSQKKAGG